MACTISNFTKLLMVSRNFGIFLMVCSRKPHQTKTHAYSIRLLQDHGTRLGENITKHLEEDIWELRPGRNRVLFFYHKDDTYVLLHHFLKKTQKTPRREIEKAKSERNDWITRKG